ncbi:hypothetical protein [Commensalibacter papalotli (ex Servin-Garciduenas et al. 2014)]|uniref:Uncharacterized protein n=1 Tax=Commensalibacter papalotli (ex Servin-Garciduenas et al. 2014) TaxID=1208583 RepID=W7DX83_9PROT|nr:hypothetical protein [Commensalibacter papalotli (ex Servin-Garciduenas et al. 2014)]EUK18808.1 hypothetical protein COMX_03630 [Commensalibacter papalotli (ex Servin-Garciduenas et al. 2014)]
MNTNPLYLVLSDDLLLFYFKIKDGLIGSEYLDKQKLHNFFKFYRPHLTNIKQLNRLINNQLIDEARAARLRPTLSKQGFINNLDLEALAHYTILKIILTDTDSEVQIDACCYVNINKTTFDTHYVISKAAGECRNDLLNFLSHVFSKAKSITIFDKHIADKEEFIKFLNLFQESQLTIFMDLKQDVCTKIKTQFAHFTIKQDNHFSKRTNHDRYIIVDNELQIILSSGIEYLFDSTKEITCIFSNYITPN